MCSEWLVTRFTIIISMKLLIHKPLSFIIIIVIHILLISSACPSICAENTNGSQSHVQNGVNDYLILLKSKSDLDKVIMICKETLSNCLMRNSYHSLLQLGFFAVSLQLKDSDAAAISDIVETKLTERVGFLEVAQSLSIETSSSLRIKEMFQVVEGSICKINYDTYRNFMQSTVSSSEMTPNVYVLDTGIFSQHEELVGHVTWGFDAVSSPPIHTDHHGHGTYVASLIIGNKLGVVRNANVVDVRVMNDEGLGRVDEILLGLDYVAGELAKRNLKQNQQRPRQLNGIINLSLVGAKSDVMKFALYALSKVVLVVGSIGDHSLFSCNFSPANSPFILAVGGINRENGLELYETNFGDCIDMRAPGEDIMGAWVNTLSNEPSNNFYKQVTGSSASAAIVTGIGVVLLNIIANDDELRDLFSQYVDDSEIIQVYKSILTYFLPFRGSTHPEYYPVCGYTSPESLHATAMKLLDIIKAKQIGSTSSNVINRVNRKFQQTAKETIHKKYHN